MCGRFALTASPADVAARFGIGPLEPFPPRPLILPTQPILVVLGGADARFGGSRAGRQGQLARWGLIPAWVKDPSAMPLLFNARAETAADRNAFRGALRHRRCLIPATGFHAPRRGGEGRGEPVFIRPREGGVIAFAGLFEPYMAGDGSEIDTAAILTTAANNALAPHHDRMPAVIPEEDFARWLNCRAHEPAAVADLLTPAPDDVFAVASLSEGAERHPDRGCDAERPSTFDAGEHPAGPRRAPR